MRSLVFAVLLVPLACASDDDGSDGAASASGSTSVADTSTAGSESPSTSVATSTTASSTSDVGTDDDTSASGDGSDTATTAADPDSSTGEPACDPGLEVATFTEVDGCGGVIGLAWCSEGTMHVDQGTVVEWMHDPPHSGPHYPTWESWDEHDEVVPRGNWVHNLEHGGIVLTYRCNDDCEPELAVLREVIAQRPELRILLTADPFLPDTERFAALSWTWVHRFDSPSLDELLCFADQHENHAPEDVP